VGGVTRQGSDWPLLILLGKSNGPMVAGIWTRMGVLWLGGPKKSASVFPPNLFAIFIFSKKKALQRLPQRNQVLQSRVYIWLGRITPTPDREFCAASLKNPPQKKSRIKGISMFRFPTLVEAKPLRFWGFRHPGARLAVVCPGAGPPHLFGFCVGLPTHPSPVYPEAAAPTNGAAGGCGESFHDLPDGQRDPASFWPTSKTKKKCAPPFLGRDGKGSWVRALRQAYFCYKGKAVPASPSPSERLSRAAQGNR